MGLSTMDKAHTVRFVFKRTKLANKAAAWQIARYTERQAQNAGKSIRRHAKVDIANRVISCIISASFDWTILAALSAHKYNCGLCTPLRRL